ncbi:hypothetical protein Glove_168g106 [Diversispora epigaea]|uniref:Protein kinase domain-containing protein n=1 Tax=Diversispora epigaea TaxID=1348612 RepID=A0A397ISR7_9GLOM|nr:hypothetical protein Glove_168g106 [Diversispora epigaea]
MVLDCATDGNLREYLKKKFNINWLQKLYNLWDLSLRGKSEKRNIFDGVLQYITPEVLSGDEEYIKAADVYSFGIIVLK